VTYYTSQTVTVTDKNIDTVTLNGEPATGSITLEGDKEATYTIVATDKAGNSTTVIVKMAPIADITESMEGMTSDNVTSDDKAALQTIVDTVTELLKDEELPAEEKEALEKAKADAEALLKAIDDADKAADTENTDKVENVTADNVTPEDKSDLEKAKADLEKALDDNSGNYTAEEKKTIEDELKRIDDALKVIENVEAVEEATSNLPATVVPDDEENVAKIEAAKKTYDALSNYEKSLVSKQTKETLDKLTAAAVAYDIIKGDGSEWKEDSNETLSFTANGDISRFLGIGINGKTVDPKHYEVKAGSTIVTLKQDYLDTLEAGKYTITFLYTNGETEGTFIVEAVEEETVPPTTEETKPGTVPETGDDANVMLWFSLMIVSSAAILVLLSYKRFFSYGGKYSK
jgi:tetratricopeptide (TPR) repeat protein